MSFAHSTKEHEVPVAGQRESTNTAVLQEATRRTAGKRPKKQKKRNRKPANPLVKGILAFCEKRSLSVAAEETEPFSSSPNNGGHLTLCLSDLPKRYTLYPPLLLLPSTFTTPQPRRRSRWAESYIGISDEDRGVLFRCIVEEGFKGLGISHVAINAPIAAETETELDVEDRQSEGSGDDHDDHVYKNDERPLRDDEEDTRIRATESRRGENLLRSPSGLVPVYGDWGPSQPTFSSSSAASRWSGDSAATKKGLMSNPTTQDFAEAFWTSVSQHKGITQCWAPLYTMFSRGNIVEKARILGLSSSSSSSTPLLISAASSTSTSQPPVPSSPSYITSTTTTNGGVGFFPGLTTRELGEDLTQVDVLDLYVGIGYFAFSYLRRGARRVFGFDINPWSIEGLRRGCVANGFGCVVLRLDEHGDIDDRDLDPLDDGVKCIAVLGDNRWAGKVVAQIERRMATRGSTRCRQGRGVNVRHANLGLLPSSRRSWDTAVQVVLRSLVPGLGLSSATGTRTLITTGWLHVHENVDLRHLADVERRVVRDIDGLVLRQLESHSRSQSQSACEWERDAQDEQQVGQAVGPGRWSVSCVHVNQVKTYAPGVMHCVFDIEIRYHEGH